MLYLVRLLRREKILGCTDEHPLNQRLARHVAEALAAQTAIRQDGPLPQLPRVAV